MTVTPAGTRRPYFSLERRSRFAVEQPAPGQANNCANAQRQVKQFVSEGRTQISADLSVVFEMSWQRVALPKGQAVLVCAAMDGIIYGFAYFDIVPMSRKQATPVAQMWRLPRELLVEGMDESIAETEVGLKVSPLIRRKFKGVGTSLMGLSLHLAQALDLPLFKVREDVSVFDNERRESFYEAVGFLAGRRINKALRSAGVGGVAPCEGKSLYFFLNGFFEENPEIERPFVIPSVHIAKRE
jgi:hypothetical protein